MNQQEIEPGLRGGLKAWLRPPRAHGDVIEDRTVSFLELFYDLVFVVLIAQIAHTLAGHVSWAGVLDFFIVFSLIWIAWLNGTLYHELHGGEDGRSRMYIFIQMGLLALLSVYAGHALDDPADGRGFAIVYTILLVQIVYQWIGVTKVDTPEMRAAARRYIWGMVPLVALAAVSAGASIDVRRYLWLGLVVVFATSVAATTLLRQESAEQALQVTESMAERFGLFTIIVLGEVVVGVVEGLGESERTFRTIATGLLALSVGYGIWWNYFDFVGRRQPREGQGPRMLWTVAHFPLALAIAAGGAGMVSLIEHAGDSQVPASTAWLLSGAVALVALSIATLARTLPPMPERRYVSVGLVGSALVALVIAAMQPAPWLLALALYLALSAVWTDAFIRHARRGTSIVES